MPIYDYVCRNCGEQFEWLVRNDEKPSCPSCGRRKLTKQFSVPAAHVAGSSQLDCPMRSTGSCDGLECSPERCSLSRGR